MQPMDTQPPADPASEVWGGSWSVDVAIHFANGTTARGYWDAWQGWQLLPAVNAPMDLDDDPRQPIGWTLDAV